MFEFNNFIYYGIRIIHVRNCWPCVIMEVGIYSGVAARAAEFRKHSEDDTKCAALSWKCIPLAVESYGA